MSENDGDPVDPTAIAAAFQAGSALAQTGKLDKTLAQLDSGAANALRLLFSPFNGFATVLDMAKSLASRAAKKLSDVPNETWVPPPRSVVNQLAAGYAQLGSDETSEESLRDFFAGLLASAMDPATAQNTHPAFANFLANMTSLEARIIACLASGHWSVWPMCKALEYQAQESEGAPPRSYHIAGVFYDVPGMEDVSLDRLTMSMSNLLRLGVFSQEFRNVRRDRYQPLFERVRAMPRLQGRELKLERGYFGYTTFGATFATVCLRDDLLRAEGEEDSEDEDD